MNKQELIEKIRALPYDEGVSVDTLYRRTEMIFALTLSDIVELIIGAIWLIGFIGAIVVGILSRKDKHE